MKLDFFILADEFVPSGEGINQKITIEGAAVTHIRTPLLPANVSRLVAIARFLIEETDTEGQEFPVSLATFTPAGEDNGYMELTIKSGPEWFDRSHPDEEKSAWFICDLKGMPVRETGVYRVQLGLRGKELAERKFILSLIDEDSAAATQK